MTKIKICGLFDPDNITAVGGEDIDFMGFIFYPKSKRYIKESSVEAVQALPKHIKKIGVFVDAERAKVMATVNLFGLDGVQLHGKETPEACAYYQTQGLYVIKAFALESIDSLRDTAAFSSYCDVFVFDTPTPDYGGSGQSFDWNILKQYTGDTPYLLSGGLGLQNIDEALAIRDTKRIGFDLNSKLENEYNLKDIRLVKELIKSIRKHERI